MNVLQVLQYNKMSYFKQKKNVGLKALFIVPI